MREEVENLIAVVVIGDELELVGARKRSAQFLRRHIWLARSEPIEGTPYRFIRLYVF